MMGMFLLCLAATAAHADGAWTVGKVVGVDVFDSQRARYTVRDGNGNQQAFWIYIEASTGKAMLADVMLAASTGNSVRIWHYNTPESFGGQSGIPTSIFFQDIGN